MHNIEQPNNKSRDDNCWLEIMLPLKRQVVGVRFLYSQADYEQCTTPEPKGPRPYCAAVKNATLGEACKLGLKHIACLSGARALGILSADEDIIAPTDINSGRRHHLMGLYADYGVSRQIAKDMVYCQHSVYGVEIAPLANFTAYNPDVVIIVSNAMNMMRLIQGYAYHSGQLKHIKVAGNQAVCQECTSYPFEMNQPNLSMFCAGTRKAAKWEDDELGMGIPFNQLASIVDGLRQTSNVMDDNLTKQQILKRAEHRNMAEQLHVTLNSNYYTGGFGTLAYHKERQKTKA